MFEEVVNREYRVKNKTIIWNSVVNGKETYRLSEYGPDLTAEELRTVVKDLAEFVNMRFPAYKNDDR